ncbi:hypothetical protein [Candidatus Nitrosopumilus sediminis]|uniref:hypothetical protein n=1 Tax=Candidatus Nitrosopumilus sediminis TaxID=1229909 RepID=UPI000A54C53D|nr:hypothetical protein [Candidatus Nitrosopumilus sediminis]
MKWGNYKSEDPENPDIIELKVAETETFETEFSINVMALIKEKKTWVECNIPLKSHESKNASLLNQWSRLSKDIKKGARLHLKTWLGTSKNSRKIRRYSLEKI